MPAASYDAPTIIWRLRRDDIFAYAIVVPHPVRTRLLWWINDRLEGNEECPDWTAALERSEAVRAQFLKDDWLEVG